MLHKQETIETNHIVGKNMWSSTFKKLMKTLVSFICNRVVVAEMFTKLCVSHHRKEGKKLIYCKYRLSCYIKASNNVKTITVRRTILSLHCTVERIILEFSLSWLYRTPIHYHIVTLEYYAAHYNNNQIFPVQNFSKRIRFRHRQYCNNFCIREKYWEKLERRHWNRFAHWKITWRIKLIGKT